MVTFAGVNHVGLTVRDLERSARFYLDVLDFVPVLDFDGALVCLHPASGFTIALQKPPNAAGNEFTELNTGLDHLGLTAASRDELVEWEQRLRSAGAEYTPIRDMDLGHHLNFRDPDNIALELFAPNARYLAALETARSDQLSPAQLREAARLLIGDQQVVRDP